MRSLLSMNNTQLLDSYQPLVAAVVPMLRGKYGPASVKEGEPYKADLGYTPPVWVKASNHLTQFYQPSETLSFELAALIRLQIQEHGDPIALSLVIPHEATKNVAASETRRWRSTGVSRLITVDGDGEIDKPIVAYPILLHISEQKFRSKILVATPSLQRALKAAYSEYMRSPLSGLSQIFDYCEGLSIGIYLEAALRKDTWRVTHRNQLICWGKCLVKRSFLQLGPRLEKCWVTFLTIAILVIIGQKLRSRRCKSIRTDGNYS